ncbi:MAG: bifunctional glycosyltransferase/class I SAM-dependent methyltransferase [Bryobacteraceae bacterium]|jgi:2-polyprenyl-3-methyl-5-hydroxy-6-metoxy-1,4-benzoquinol methylase
MKIGILIVAYNAVTTLVSLLKRIPPEAWERVSEVVVFDDASSDHTYELAVGYKATAQLDKLTIIRNRKNLGYGGNQREGYRYFIERGFDIVVLLHGDGQYAPEVLPQIYGPLAAGEADAVFGSRMMKDYGGPLKGGMPLYKYIGNRVLTWMENRALGMHLTEFHSGYRAYRLDCLRQIDLSRMTEDFHFDTEIIIKLQHQGFRIKEVPIPTYYGGEICYVNGMRYAWDVTQAVWRYRRTVYGNRRFPEFQEYWRHYPLKRSRHSSHDYLMRLVGEGHTILDIGCGEGYLSRELAAAGNQVIGVDLLDKPQCLDSMKAYHCCDLSHGLDAGQEPLRSTHPDRVLLLDVLEHLTKPEPVLEACRTLLAPQGIAIITVPNIANIWVRLSLLLGRFEYTDRGILDRTHVRFYTRKAARRLLAENGFEVIRERATVVPVEIALTAPPSNPVMIALNRTLGAAAQVFPTLFGYQLLFVARAAR